MTAVRQPTDTLAAALPREMVRVTKLAAIYRSVEMGFIAATMMEASVAGAQAAIAANDIIAMMRAYEDLKGYSA